MLTFFKYIILFNRNDDPDIDTSNFEMQHTSKRRGTRFHLATARTTSSAHYDVEEEEEDEESDGEQIRLKEDYLNR
jgi:hypothetical protein